MEKYKNIITSLEARWFMSSMATGALGVLWYKMALFLQEDWMTFISITLIILAFLLFIFATLGYVFRIAYFFHLVKADFMSPKTSKFFSGISISLSVLSTATTVVLTPEVVVTNEVGKYLAGILYAAGIILGLLFLLGVCSTMIKSSENNVEHAIGVCLLPPVGLFVNIFAGNFWIQKFISGSSLAHTLTMIHFFLFTLLLLLTSWVMTFIVFRLRFHKMPKKEMAPSFFIPLAPAGVSIIALASLIPLFGSELPYANLLKLFGYIFIPTMISFGLFWSLILLTILHSYLSKDGIPYTLGFWALVFPMSAFGISIFVASKFLPGISGFAWVGVVWCIISSLIWLMVFSKTIHGILTGKAFVRPGCLKN